VPSLRASWLGSAAALAVCAVTTACGESPRLPTAPRTSAQPLPAPPAAGFTLSGFVRTGEGVPIAEASVWAQTGSKYGVSARTDAAGGYSLANVRGTFRVAVSKPGFRSVDSTVTVDKDATQNFTLLPGVQIGGFIEEAGVGRLGGATVEMISGPDAGAMTTSTSWGAYGFGYVLPGEMTLRASKPGYDSVERTIRAEVDQHGINFTLKWAYGTCLTAVDPVLFERVPSAGATRMVSVRANDGRSWTATSADSWIEVASGSTGAGFGTVLLRVLPHPLGALQARRGALMIRCGGGGGQNVWVDQLQDCQTRLEWAPGSPVAFPAAGGTGRVLVYNGVSGCRSQDVSEVSWIRLAGAGSYMTGEVNFIVEPNATGAARIGVIVVNEARWEILQEP